MNAAVFYIGVNEQTRPAEEMGLVLVFNQY